MATVRTLEAVRARWAAGSSASVAELYNEAPRDVAFLLSLLETAEVARWRPGVTCRRGHPLHVQPSGRKACKVCQLARCNRYQARKLGLPSF